MTAFNANSGSKESAEPLLRSKMPELDTIRGIAILWVLVHHAFLPSRGPFTSLQLVFLKGTSAGHLGVNLFFVLSGFLITGLLLDSRERADYFKRFYVRRALRILPAYYAILILLVVLGMTSRGFLIASLLYCANLSLLFGFPMSYKVLWSLAVEEQFYLIWPAIIRIVSIRRLLGIAVGTILVPIFLRYVSFRVAYPHGFVENQATSFDFYTWNCADGLACGSLLAIVIRHFSFTRKQLLRFCAVLLGIAAVVEIGGIPLGVASRRNAIGAALQPTSWNIAFTGLLGVFLLLGTGPWKKLVTPRILRFFGEISYGLYLIHYGVIQQYNRLIMRWRPEFAMRVNPFAGLWLCFLVAGSLSVLLAFLSRRYFEEPFLRLKNRWTGA